MIWAMIVGGLALLALGGELVVRGSVAAAVTLRASPVIIGVVLMGFGTSLPELVTSVESALAGLPGIALGNVVGSNIANLLLIAGLAAVLAATRVSGPLIWRDGMMMLATTAALTLLIYYDGLGPLAGFGLLAALAVYLAVAVTSRTGVAGGGHPGEEDPSDSGAAELPFVGWRIEGLFGALVVFALGMVATVVGAGLLVEGASDLARRFAVPDALIGATIVAVGTSLPELAATIAAALRRQTEMAIGNVLGSNIFNVAAIVGVCALIAPLPAPPTLAAFDVWAMLAATIAVLILALTGGRLSRWEGLAMLSAYVLYVVLAVDRSM